MTKPRTYQTEAIIIKKTKLGEADSIFTLYTPDLGKIQGFARSVRKPKSKLAGHLELLTHSLVSLARGRNLDTIIGSQTIDSFLTLKGDLWPTSCALYATELVNQFTADHIENGRLFQLLLETMKQLSQATDKDLVLRYFELHLLEEVGYRPQLRECVTCHRQLEPVVNWFCPRAGGMLCPACRQSQTVCYPLSVNAQKVLRVFQDGAYAVVDQIRVSTQLSAEMETVLSGFLRYILEREVRSAAWLNELREQRMASRQGPGQ